MTLTQSARKNHSSASAAGIQSQVHAPGVLASLPAPVRKVRRRRA